MILNPICKQAFILETPRYTKRWCIVSCQHLVSLRTIFRLSSRNLDLPDFSKEHIYADDSPQVSLQNQFQCHWNRSPSFCCFSQATVSPRLYSSPFTVQVIGLLYVRISFTLVTNQLHSPGRPCLNFFKKTADYTDKLINCALANMTRGCITLQLWFKETLRTEETSVHGVCLLVGKALLGTFPNKQAYERNKAETKLIMDFWRG